MDNPEFSNLLTDEIKALQSVKDGLLKVQQEFGGSPTLNNALRLASDYVDVSYMTLVNIRGVVAFQHTAAGEAAPPDLKLKPEPAGA